MSSFLLLVICRQLSGGITLLLFRQGYWDGHFFPAELSAEVSITGSISRDASTVMHNVQPSPVQLTRRSREGGITFHPFYFILSLQRAGLASDWSVAVATVNGSIVPGPERHLGVFATSCADSGKHFPFSSTTIATTLPFISCPARGTALGLVGETLGSEEFLLASIKDETCAAVHALKSLVYIGHE